MPQTRKIEILPIEPHPCRFCKNKDIALSDKTTTISFKRKRHVSLFCRNCHCYGPRVIGEPMKEYPYTASEEDICRAIALWNGD